jgi:hypothetical protein
MKQFKSGEAVTARRKLALVRLEIQLEKGVKVDKTNRKEIPLTEKDISRINKEMEILKSRI